MSRAIETLKHEHDVILSALNILDTLRQQMSADQTVDAGDIDMLLSVFSEFADRCHHGKEEDLLFPALVKAGLSTAAGPLAQMLLEHQQARNWTRDMKKAAEPPLNLNDFGVAAQAYSHALRRHIEKENTILFPMAEETLTETQLATLADAFEAHEQQVIGADRHEDLHRIIKRLQKRYLM